MKSLSSGEMASSRGSHWRGVWIVSKDREDGIRNRTQHFLMMPVITWEKKFHTIGPAQVLTWRHKTVSVIENLLPHSAYIDDVPRTVLGLRIAKLNTSSLLSHSISLDLHWSLPSLPRWRETRVSWPEGCSRPSLPSHLQLFCPPICYHPPLYSGWGEELWAGAPQSGWGASDVALNGLLSLDFCFSAYMVHLNTRSVICHTPSLGFGDVISRGRFSIERCYRWDY